MSAELAWSIAGVITAVLAGLVIPGIGFLIKLGRKIEQINHQVTRNGGQNNPPTLPDKIADLKTVVRAEVADVRTAVVNVDDTVKEHRSWAEAENRRLWRELSKKADRSDIDALADRTTTD